MNDTNPPVKFLTWILCIVIALGLFGQLKELTYKAAKMAVDAHQHHQISYGKFSRQLWRKPNKK